MNCPNCRVGIMEPIGYIDLADGQCKFYYLRLPIPNEVNDRPALVIHVCSRECGHVHFESTKNSFFLLRQQAREAEFSSAEKEGSDRWHPIQVP